MNTKSAVKQTGEGDAHRIDVSTMERTKAYDRPCLAAYVYINGHSLGFSKYSDEKGWACDSHFGPDMYPYFSHGIGSRCTIKQIATGKLANALDAAAQEIS
jgi:hypothetical protein